MNIVDITEDNINEFSELIDEDTAENIGRKYYHGKALMGDENDLLAALVWEYKKNSGDEEGAETESELCLLAMKDGTKGGELFEAYKDEIEDETVVKSFFEFPDTTKTVVKSLSDQKFSPEETESRDIYLKLGDLTAHKLAQKSAPSYVKALSSVTARALRRGIIGCLYNGKKGLLEDIAILPIAWYDQNISCVIRTDDEVTGLLLVHKTPTGTLMPVLLYASGPNYQMDLINMIRFSIRAAAENYDADTDVMIRRHSTAVKALAGKLFPGIKGDAALYGERKE